MRIRAYRDSDRREWLRMSMALFPELTAEEGENDMRVWRDRGDTEVFVVERPDGLLAGYVEVGTRPYADGCSTSPVGYVEAWYVDPDVRRSGYGRQLLAAAEAWARQCGYTEMASDALLENDLSHRAHLASGYVEVERVVQYRKALTVPPDADAVPMLETSLATELIALAAEDQRVRSELLAEGTLFGGYHPRMEAVHRQNAMRLREIIAQHGWPGEALVGKEAAAAAGMIAQHAIGEPDFQRACLRALEAAALRNEVPAWQPAMLEDRIRVFEGRLQRYGTQLETDDDGNLYPHAIEDPDGVDERRRAVGLDPLAERLARAGRVPPPADRAAYQRGYEQWLRAVGWRQ